MKKATAFLLFAILGLAVPLASAAQVNDTSARQAEQKRNARRSHKQVGAEKHALRKTQRSLGKPGKNHKAHPSIAG